MGKTRVLLTAAGALIVSAALASAQQGNTNRLSVAFSDPSRPGTVKINIFNGGITVRAYSGKEVVVATEDTIVASRDGRETSVPQRPETAGLRRLSQRSGLRIEEENNVMTISSGRIFNDEDISVQVPTRTNLVLTTVNGDDVTVDGVDGAIEVTTVNAEIRLADVSGTVVAHATNGNVRVTLRQVTADKPLAFTSLNGDVDVTLPPSVKGNLKLRSDQGEVYTDFDVQIQQQRPTPNPPKVGTAPPAPPAPPLPPLPPLPPGASADDLRERERAARELARQVRGNRGNRIEIDTAIYGTINGGGPEFELRTFNGNIYLRKGK
jgi:putative adhesin